ncbi:2-dehydro-3-deoxy-phosphogluconate aldolase [Amycolatopsis acidiphila]|nr:2-dehydro-3-deoxy-phosphogluconate aldolase [Amycolatopsis acidiphila]
MFPRPEVIAILRAASADRFREVAELLYETGVRVIELTLTTPGAVDALADLRARLPGDVVLGMGTVLTEADVEVSVAAGAGCLFTPTCRPNVIEVAGDRGVPIVAGAATPTEIYDAYAAGASAVKVFPAAQLGGPGFLRAIRAPLPAPPLVPTGGVEISDVGEYFAAGAAAVGLGSPLLGDALQDGGLGALADRVRVALAARDAVPV